MYSMILKFVGALQRAAAGDDDRGFRHIGRALVPLTTSVTLVLSAPRSAVT